MNTRTRIPSLILALGLILSATPVWADDAFSLTNPITGKTESIWSATPPGGTSEVFFSILEGTGWTPSQQLTSNTLADSNPNLAYNGQGDRYAVWWRNDTVDGVYFSTQAAGGSWSAATLVSSGTTDARLPRVASFQGNIFVSYETVPPTGNRGIRVSITDGPDPWSDDFIETSGQTGQLVVRLHTESGHLWVDWIDSGSALGWSEYVSGRWSAVSYESYSGSSDIDEARGRIRSAVLN